MPTPMPIIEARIGVVAGMSTTVAARPSIVTLMPRPNRAMPMGRPMARMEPKASRRMTAAARRPMSSAAWASGCSTNCGSSPPTSMAIPWSASGSPTATRASRSVVSSSVHRHAVRHLGEGGGAVRARLGRRVRHRLDVGQRLSPSDGVGDVRRPLAVEHAAAIGWNTSWAEAPDAAGNRSSRRSWACWDSTPGIRKVSVYSPPTRPASTPRPRRAASQRSTTRRRWVTHQRPRRWRARAIPLVWQLLSKVTM